MAKRQFQKIIKEWNEATPKEVWEGTRDNFIFGFLVQPLWYSLVPKRI
jgi:endonuclease I